ncbi:hypothetical protein FRC07_010967, partial [Ceratobasidium sp. 392]
MAVMSRLLPMVAFSTFALFLVALLATPTNAFESNHAHGHSGLAMRKRNAAKLAKRCRPKMTSESADPTSDPTSTPVPTMTKFKSSTTALATSRAVTTTSAAQPDIGGGTSPDPNKKLLMAWPGGITDIDKWKGGGNVAGVYSWSCYDPTKGLYPFYPMLWGPKQADSFVKLDVSKYNLCFGPNEPNHEAQANMSPGDAAWLWKDKLEPARNKGCKLVSPAVTSAPSGKTWLQDFFKA